MTTSKPSLMMQADVPIRVEDVLTELTTAVSQYDKNHTFDNATLVFRKSRDCWITLLSRAVYGPNRTPPEAYLAVTKQLANAVRVLELTDLLSLNLARNRAKMKYIARIMEYNVLVKILQNKGVGAVSLYIEKRR